MNDKQWDHCMESGNGKKRNYASQLGSWNWKTPRNPRTTNSRIPICSQTAIIILKTTTTTTTTCVEKSCCHPYLLSRPRAGVIILRLISDLVKGFQPPHFWNLHRIERRVFPAGTDSETPRHGQAVTRSNKCPINFRGQVAGAVFIKASRPKATGGCAQCCTESHAWLASCSGEAKGAHGASVSNTENSVFGGCFVRGTYVCVTRFTPAGYWALNNAVLTASLTRWRTAERYILLAAACVTHLRTSYAGRERVTACLAVAPRGGGGGRLASKKKTYLSSGASLPTPSFFSCSSSSTAPSVFVQYARKEAARGAGRCAAA